MIELPDTPETLAFLELLAATVAEQDAEDALATSG